MAATLTAQNTAAGNSVNSANCAITVNSGDLLIVVLNEKDGGTLATPSSSVDGSFTQAATRAATARRVAIFYKKNATAGSHTITVDWGAARTFDFNVSAWGGCLTTG